MSYSIYTSSSLWLRLKGGRWRNRTPTCSSQIPWCSRPVAIQLAAPSDKLSFLLSVFKERVSCFSNLCTKYTACSFACQLLFLNFLHKKSPVRVQWACKVFERFFLFYTKPATTVLLELLQVVVSDVSSTVSFIESINSFVIRLFISLKIFLSKSDLLLNIGQQRIYIWKTCHFVN